MSALGNPSSICAGFVGARLIWMRGISVNERVVWYASKHREEEHAALERVLEELGLEATMSEDLEDLRSLLSRVEPVLLLTELDDAGGWEGWDIISAIREEGIVLPVIVISDERSGEGAVAAFEAGGNDYLAKPVHLGEFKCRILNVIGLTRRRQGLNNLLKVDGLLLDPSRRLVSREGKEMIMTPKEFDLLYYLAANLGDVCPRNEILRQVWGYHFQADTNVVDVYIRHLRLKVDKGYRNKLIHTVRGTGYVMRAPVSSATC